ncbi:MAG TPA: CHAT domain-containing protein, partial [Elainellaceae cyanobacterium]
MMYPDSINDSKNSSVASSTKILRNSFGIQDNLRALEQNAVLLYPLILDDRIELVLVTPNSPPARYPINVSRSDLNAAIVEFRQALETPTSNPEAIAQQLYTWLIQPLASDLDAINAETIIYAPDGVLRYVLDEDFSPTATVPIMDDHTIVHLATHAEFVQGTPADSFIVFGNGDRVTLEEIKQWRGRFRQVDLIVLSFLLKMPRKILETSRNFLGASRRFSQNVESF